MAAALTDDWLGWVPIADRIYADLLLEKERRGLPISEADLERVRSTYGRRQSEIAARASDYLGSDASS